MNLYLDYLNYQTALVCMYVQVPEAISYTNPVQPAEQVQYISKHTYH